MEDKVYGESMVNDLIEKFIMFEQIRIYRECMEDIFNCYSRPFRIDGEDKQ